MTATLPSLATDTRERRVRAIRRLLHDHIALLDEQDRVMACECGWVKPRALFGGRVAHTDHVAALVADL